MSLRVRRSVRRVLAAGAVASALLVGTIGCAGSVPDPAQSVSRPVALVYDGPQGCPDCAPTIAEILESGDDPFRVEFVGPGTGTELSAGVLAKAQLYVQPGGGADLATTWDNLAPQAQAVRDWVEGGGSYLGLCFGAYLAGRDPGFDLLPGDSFGWAGSPGATVTDARDTVVPLTWRGEQRWVYFQDGPGFDLAADADVEVLATYPDGVPAVLVASYGSGRVGVAGPHPEADESWYDEAGLTNPDGYSTDLIEDLLATTLARD